MAGLGATDAPRLRGHTAEAGSAAATLAYGRGLLAIQVSDAVGFRTRPATPDEWERLAAWLTQTERLRPLPLGERLQRRINGSLVRAVLALTEAAPAQPGPA